MRRQTEQQTSAAPHHRPFPLRLVFPLIFVALYLSHASLLRLPYYWDEAGYYIPAAYDLFRTGTLIPYSTLTNAHPPLPALYLALWWKLSGFAPATTRFAELLIASFALLGVYRLALRVTGQLSIAVATTLLTALYPVWFAQSTLAHADLMAAAFTVWGLAFYAARPLNEPDEGQTSSSMPFAAVCFALAALSKETAIVTPVALALYELSRWRRPPSLERAAVLLTSLLPLCGWYLYHWRRTGHIFGNPEYLRYNATSTLAPMRVAAALLHRALHLTAHMNLFVPVLCAFASLLLVPRALAGGAIRPALARGAWLPLAYAVVTNWLVFSVLGGALLTRYLLPLYPLVLLLCVATFWRRVPAWGGLVALSGFAFVLGLFFNPPYRFAPEDNLTYADAIQLDRHAIHQVVVRYPHQTVLTAWPVSDELTRPELGYMKTAIPVVTINDFSAPEIARAAAVRDNFSVGLIFSTKYDPPHLPFLLGHRSEALDRQYFGFHQDLSPEAIARLLGGTVVWREEREGLWAAVVHFDRPQQASLH